MKNKIEIDFKKLPTDIRRFVKREIQISNENDISVIMPRTRGIKLGQNKYNGYFDSDVNTLAVACGKSLAKWLPTLVHESCHRDQSTENTDLWKREIGDVSPLLLFDLWFEHYIELNPKQKYAYMMHVLEVELDCERRAVRKIVDNDLPIHPFEYIQRANAYVYFYHTVHARRKWYDLGKEPYETQAVWKHMPVTFDNDYSTLPSHYKDLYMKHCFNGEK